MSRARAHVVDAVRGAAVVFMIVWHTADAWLLDGLREDPAFRWLRITGGLAAPIFLLLAGVAVGLVEPKVHDRASTLGALRRAGQIAVLGYALKLFAFGVDRAALVGPHAPFVVAAAVGLAVLYASMDDLPAGWAATRWRSRMALGGIALFATLLVELEGDPRALELVLRLDVLQGIGASLAVLALVMPATALRSPLGPSGTLVVLGVGVALATPSLGALDLHVASEPLARALDYVARLTPYPNPTGARFPLFPWLSYPLLGAAIGRAMRGRTASEPFALPPPLRAPWVMIGAAIVAIAFFEPNPLPQLLLAPGELVRNLVRVIFNLAIALTLAGAFATFGARGPSPMRALALIGRHSLSVYAVHLEIAYGLPSVVIQRALGYAGWVVAASALSLAMLALAWALERRPRSDAHREGSARAMQA